jgi:hypothetical protein
MTAAAVGKVSRLSMSVDGLEGAGALHLRYRVQAGG